MLSNTFQIRKCVLAVRSLGGFDDMVTIGIVSGQKCLPESYCLIQNQAEPSILNSLQMENLVDSCIVHSMIYCEYHNYLYNFTIKQNY